MPPERTTCAIHGTELVMDLAGVTGICLDCRHAAAQDKRQTPVYARILMSLESVEPQRTS